MGNRIDKNLWWFYDNLVFIGGKNFLVLSFLVY